MFDDRLAEIVCGDFEGEEETAESTELFWQATQSGNMGTEKFEMFIKRNCDLCDMIMEKYKGKNVLIVTHAANSRIINYYFNGRSKNYNFGKRIIEKGGLITFEN